MSGLISGLIGAVSAAIILSISAKTRKPPRPNAEGWKALHPSWLIKGALVGCTGLSTFFGYIWLFVGSARPDAETQMIFALGLFVTFGFFIFCLAWMCFFRTISWKGNQLQISRVLGSTSTYSFGDISAATKSELLGIYRLVFKNGKSIWISTEMHGINQLLAKLPRKQI